MTISAHLIIDRSLIRLMSIDLLLGIILVYVLKADLFLGAWLFLTMVLFFIGGWFVRELFLITRGSSPFVFLGAAGAVGIVWLPLYAIAGYSFISTIIAGRYFARRSLVKGVGSHYSIIGLFSALATVGMALGLLATPAGMPLVSLWLLAVPFALAGWFFPEVDLLFGVRLGKPTFRSIAVYVLIMYAGLVEFLVLGSGYRFSLLVSLFPLLLFMHLRASVVDKMAGTTGL